MSTPTRAVRTPRINVADALNRETNRTLLTYLASIEEPVRAKTARETLRMSIAQLGLAMRSLERYGLVTRAHRAVEEGSRASHPFLEATELGREQVRLLQARTPPEQTPS